VTYWIANEPQFGQQAIYLISEDPKTHSPAPSLRSTITRRHHHLLRQLPARWRLG
jgi:hypothetical protein